MASKRDELRAEFANLKTQQGAVQFIAAHTGLSDDRVARVYLQAMGQPWPHYTEELDLHAQAKKAGLSFEDYAVAISPLMQMSVEQAEARKREIQARLDRGEDPGLSEDELEGVKKLTTHFTAIASLSGEDEIIVMKVFDGIIALDNRRSEILRALIHESSSGEERP